MHNGVLRELGRSRYLHLNESGRNKPVEQVPGLWMVLFGIHGNETPASVGGTDRQRKLSHRDGYGKS